MKYIVKTNGYYNALFTDYWKACKLARLRLSGIGQSQVINARSNTVMAAWIYNCHSHIVKI